MYTYEICYFSFICLLSFVIMLLTYEFNNTYSIKSFSYYLTDIAKLTAHKHLNSTGATCLV